MANLGDRVSQNTGLAFSGLQGSGEVTGLQVDVQDRVHRWGFGGPVSARTKVTKAFDEQALRFSLFVGQGEFRFSGHKLVDEWALALSRAGGRDRFQAAAILDLLDEARDALLDTSTSSLEVLRVLS